MLRNWNKEIKEAICLAMFIMDFTPCVIDFKRGFVDVVVIVFAIVTAASQSNFRANLKASKIENFVKRKEDRERGNIYKEKV